MLQAERTDGTSNRESGNRKRCVDAKSGKTEELTEWPPACRTVRARAAEHGGGSTHQKRAQSCRSARFLLKRLTKAAPASAPASSISSAGAVRPSAAACGAERGHEEGGGSGRRRWEGRHSAYGPPGLLPRSAAPGADAQTHLQPVQDHHGQGGRRAPAPAPAPAAGRQRCCRWWESARE